MKQCLLCKQNFVAKIYFSHIFSLKNYQQSKICEKCQSKFEKLTGSCCKICSKNLKETGICTDCKIWAKKYNGKVMKNQSLYRYDQNFHDLMVQYKRYGDYVLRDVLKELCLKEVKKIKADLYIPIPTSPEHRKRRQFDTISAIYEDIFPLTKLLMKNKGSRAQGEKNRLERLQTPQSFLLASDVQIKENIDIRKILLLDDIYTTGRTLYHARDRVQEVFPDSQIESFSICR